MIKTIYFTKVFLQSLICIFVGLAQNKLYACESTYYEITDGKTIGYLVGSVHTGVKTLYPLDKRLDSLMIKISVLALEAPVEPSKEWRDAILSDLRITDQDDFFNYISEKTFEKARLIIINGKQINQSVVEALPKIHPYITYQFLGNEVAKKITKTDLPGMELYFWMLAKKYGVKVVQLEDPANLASSIKSLSKDEIEILMETQFSLFEKDEFRNENNKTGEIIGTFVRRGDYASVKVFNESYMKSTFHWTQSMFDKIYYSRNQGIANNIIKMLKNGNSFLALVGAAHLTDDVGIVNILKQSGYSVVAR